MPLRLACLAALLCCAAGAQAARPATEAAGPITKEVRKAHLERIEAEYDAGQARCKPLERRPRNVCYEQVRGARDIASAELEMQYQPSAENDEKLRVARAEASYGVSLERCKALEGNAKDICRKDAMAVLAAAKADAKLQKEIVGQNLKSEKVVRERTEAAERQLEAQFAAARERCGMLPVEGREACLADAKRRFGRS